MKPLISLLLNSLSDNGNFYHPMLIVELFNDEQNIYAWSFLFTSDPPICELLLFQVSGSLNSSYCYILQTGTSVFTWIGNLSSTRDHDLLDRMLELINVTDP